MKFNVVTIGITVILLYLLNTTLLYLDNVETIGLILLFFFSLIINTLMYSVLFSTNPGSLSYSLYGISALSFISTFLIFLGITNLHKAHAKRSEPIQHFPERRRALTNYEILYCTLQGLLLLGSGLLITGFAPAISFGQLEQALIGLTSIIGVGIWLGLLYFDSSPKQKETAIRPFVIGAGCSIIPYIFVYFMDKYIPVLSLIPMTLMLESSAFLIYLSNWIYQTSKHVLL